MLTPDQITWQKIQKNREVDRLPSHFVCVSYNFEEKNDFATPINFWHKDNFTFKKAINFIRNHIEKTFTGRYYIGRAADGSRNFMVGFEDPAEANFFQLQIDHIVKVITRMLEKNNRL